MIISKKLKKKLPILFFLIWLFVIVIALSINGQKIENTNGYFEPQVLSVSNEYTVKADVETDTKIIYKDVRAYILDQYFLAHQSPLYLYGEKMVEACDYYNGPKDCTILAAIARNESYLCNYKGSLEMKNCWGFGGGGEHRRTFSDFTEAIYKITDVLVNQYGKRYIEDPVLMQDTFCGSEPGCEKWGENIKYFTKEINDFGLALGLKSILSYREN